MIPNDDLEISDDEFEREMPKRDDPNLIRDYLEGHVLSYCKRKA